VLNSSSIERRFVPPEFFPVRLSVRPVMSRIPLMLINFCPIARLSRLPSSERKRKEREREICPDDADDDGGGGAEFPGLEGRRARFYLSLELLTGCEREGEGAGGHTG